MTTDHRAWLRGWLAAACPDGAPADDAPLFGDGPLNSADFVELLLAIEERRGRPVGVGLITPDAFRNVDAILAHVFAESGHARHAG